MKIPHFTKLHRQPSHAAVIFVKKNWKKKKEALAALKKAHKQAVKEWVESKKDINKSYQPHFTREAIEIFNKETQWKEVWGPLEDKS